MSSYQTNNGSSNTKASLYQRTGVRYTRLFNYTAINNIWDNINHCWPSV